MLYFTIFVWKNTSLNINFCVIPISFLILTQYETIYSPFIWQNAYYQFKTGTLEDKLWHSMERTLMNNHKSNVGYKDYWEQRKSLFSDDYVAYVEQTVANTTILPEYKIFGVQEPINGN